MKILVVEDSPSTRAFLATTIEAGSDTDDLEVVEAGSGFEALKVLPHHKFDAILTAAGDKKIQVIKVVRAITGLGLKEAKDLVDNAPKPIKEKVSKAEALDIKAKIEESGGVVDVK